MKRNAYLTTKQRSRGISWSFFGCQHGRARRPGSDNGHYVNLMELDRTGSTLMPINGCFLGKSPKNPRH